MLDIVITVQNTELSSKLESKTLSCLTLEVLFTAFAHICGICQNNKKQLVCVLCFP